MQHGRYNFEFSRSIFCADNNFNVGTYYNCEIHNTNILLYLYIKTYYYDIRFIVGVYSRYNMSVMTYTRDA